jgi:hypothetical protein
MLIRIDGGSVKLFTRNGHDWTDRMPKLQAAVDSLPVENAWLDGVEERNNCEYERINCEWFLTPERRVCPIMY